MKSKLISTLGLVVLSLTVAGCNGATKADGGVYKSTDAGKVFEQKVKIDEKQNIGQADILTLEFDPNNYNTIYLGTRASGILRSIDGGETWVKDVNNFQLVSSIAIDPNNSQTIYLAALKEGRGKILKTTNGGQQWIESLTQKENGPNFISLAIDRADSRILYAGDSKGAIYKTEDAGETWKTLLWAKSAVRDIAMDSVNTSIIYFGTTGSGLMVTKDEGKTFTSLISEGNILNVEAHPTKTGVLYVSDKKGIHESTDMGTTWTDLSTLLKSDELGTRAYAADPSDDNIFYFASGRALYKTVNGGDTWSTVQFNMNRGINLIKIDPSDTSKIYLGFSNPTKSFSLLPF